MVRKKDRVGEVIKLLREQPRTWSELKNQGIPGSTLKGVIDTLRKWKLMEERDGRYWWYEHKQVYENPYEHGLVLKHSRSLVNIPLDEKIAYLKKETGVEIPYESLFLDENLKRHLKTGHVEIYKKYEEMEEAAKELGKVNFAISFMLEDLASKSAKDARHNEKQSKEKIYRDLKDDLTSKLDNLKQRIYKDSTPLSGSCKRCPEVALKSK